MEVRTNVEILVVLIYQLLLERCIVGFDKVGSKAELTLGRELYMCIQKKERLFLTYL